MSNNNVKYKPTRAALPHHSGVTLGIGKAESLYIQGWWAAPGQSGKRLKALVAFVILTSGI
jgi:hypothetical protein